jgi:hypothetical protein
MASLKTETRVLYDAANDAEVTVEVRSLILTRQQD